MDEKEYPKPSELIKPPGYLQQPEYLRSAEYSADKAEYLTYPPEYTVPAETAEDTPAHTHARSSKFGAKLRTFILSVMAGASVVAGVKSLAPELFEEVMPMRETAAEYLENYDLAFYSEDAADAERMTEHELWRQVFGAANAPYYGVFESEEALAEALTLRVPEESDETEGAEKYYEYTLELPVHQGGIKNGYVFMLDKPNSAVMRVEYEGETSYHILDSEAMEINARYDIETSEDGSRHAKISFFGNGASLDTVLDDSQIDSFTVLRCSNERNLSYGKQSFSIIVKVNNR